MDDEQEKQATNKPARDPETGQLLPGNTANPAGRPKRENAWASIRNEILSASKVKLSITVPDKDGMNQTRVFDLTVGEEKTIRHAIIVRQAQNALSGDNDAIRDLMNREEGMPRQAVDLGGQKDNPLVVADTFKFQIVDSNDTDKPEAGIVSTEQKADGDIQGRDKVR